MKHITIETTILKSADRSESFKQLKALSKEEERLQQFNTEEGPSNELREVQTARINLYNELLQPISYSELNSFSGMSFVLAFFNRDIFNTEFEVSRDKIGEFVVNCDLVLANPNVAESILPVIPAYEPEEKEGNYYDVDYINDVQQMKNIFLNILSTTDWGNEVISLRFS